MIIKLKSNNVPTEEGFYFYSWFGTSDRPILVEVKFGETTDNETGSIPYQGLYVKSVRLGEDTSPLPSVKAYTRNFGLFSGKIEFNCEKEKPEVKDFTITLS